MKSNRQIYVYILVAFLSVFCAVVFTLVFRDPVFSPGKKDVLVQAGESGEISAVRIEDGFNIPVVLEKHGYSWVLVFDGNLIYPADNFKINDFVSGITEEKRILRPLSFYPADSDDGGHDFPVKITVYGENSTTAGIIRAGSSEAGGGFRYVKLPSGIFKTEDFFSVPGLSIESIAAVKNWIDRSPFRDVFSGQSHGNIQHMVFRDFAPGVDMESEAEGYATSFSANRDASMIGRIEDMISGIECSDITNIPLEKFFEIECTTGYDRRLVFSYGFIFSDGGVYGVVSESGRNWIAGAETVLELYNVCKSSVQTNL